MVIARRWEDTIHCGPNGTSFCDCWTDRVKNERNILVITGLGWDPRMTVLANVLKGMGGRGLRDFHLLNYRPTKAYISPNGDFLKKNRCKFSAIIKGFGHEKEIDIITRRDGNTYCGDRAIVDLYLKCDLNNYSDILVDISALPKSLYFTLLLILIRRRDKEYPKLNVHVIACQDVDLDEQINESADDTRILQGFKSNFTLISRQQITKIWVPVLEKNYAVSLRKLYSRITPKDVYPVLPFPSRNPRTDDDLLIEYRSIFVDEWNLNPMNIIYAVEDDPRDVYRSLLKLLNKQREILEPLGGVSMAVSALSSKLSSIGIFMAAFDGDMAVVHAIGRHSPPTNLADSKYWGEQYGEGCRKNLHSVWLTGEPYA